MARSYRRLTLRSTAARIRASEEPWLCIREFLDDFYAAGAEERAALLTERPEPVHDRPFDAYLAALAEHMAVHFGLPVPGWTGEPERFRDQWWFPTVFKSLHAMALVQSPASFRRRGIFVDETEFQRC